MGAERIMVVPIELNRASMGDGDFPFVVIMGEEVARIAYVSKDRITIDEQKFSRRPTGRLTVDIVKEEGELALVETESETGKLRFWVNRVTGKVVKDDDWFLRDERPTIFPIIIPR